MAGLENSDRKPVCLERIVEPYAQCFSFKRISGEVQQLRAKYNMAKKKASLERDGHKIVPTQSNGVLLTYE